MFALFVLLASSAYRTWTCFRSAADHDEVILKTNDNCQTKRYITCPAPYIPYCVDPDSGEPVERSEFRELEPPYCSAKPNWLLLEPYKYVMCVSEWNWKCSVTYGACQFRGANHTDSDTITKPAICRTNEQPACQSESFITTKKEVEDNRCQCIPKPTRTPLPTPKPTPLPTPSMSPLPVYKCRSFNDVYCHIYDERGNIANLPICDDEPGSKCICLNETGHYKDTLHTCTSPPTPSLIP